MVVALLSPAVQYATKISVGAASQMTIPVSVSYPAETGSISPAGAGAII